MEKKKNGVFPCQIEESPQGRYVCYSDILGRGSYKTVYRGYDTHNGIEVAWNSIHLGSLSERECNSIIKEIDTLKRLSCENENIISFLTKDLVLIYYLCIVLPNRGSEIP